jgi:uncharacterized radical SAM protein YgiQ
MHQGSIIQSRSRESIISEIRRFPAMPGFRGVIPDIGGPSANMYGDSCPQWIRAGACNNRECSACPSLRTGIQGYLDLLDEAESLPGVKHAFIGSGIRHDLVPPDTGIMERICSHVSGHLKVAPEHIVQTVTNLMNKPGIAAFEAFRKVFEESQKGKKKRQYLVPYLMSGHPGCTLPDMVALALYLKDNSLYTEQVQDFTPTPMTASTVMYATGLDPKTMQGVFVPKDEEKQIQRAILHWKEESRYDLVRTGLLRAGRSDLIGSAPHTLISGTRPYKKVKPETESGERKQKTGFVRVIRHRGDR